MLSRLTAPPRRVVTLPPSRTQPKTVILSLHDEQDDEDDEVPTPVSTMFISAKVTDEALESSESSDDEDSFTESFSDSEDDETPFSIPVKSGTITLKPLQAPNPRCVPRFEFPVVEPRHYDDDDFIRELEVLIGEQRCFSPQTRSLFEPLLPYDYESNSDDLSHELNVFEDTPRAAYYYFFGDRMYGVCEQNGSVHPASFFGSNAMNADGLPIEFVENPMFDPDFHLPEFKLKID